MPDAADPVLAKLADDVSAGALPPLSVVLLVGGAVISGDLIAEAGYFDSLGIRLRDGALERFRGRREPRLDGDPGLLAGLGADLDVTADRLATTGHAARRDAGRRSANDNGVGDLDPARGTARGAERHPGTAFLHLRDVTIRAGGGGPVRLEAWRVRLADVVGWEVGAYEWAD